MTPKSKQFDPYTTWLVGFLNYHELDWIKDFPTCGGPIGLKNTPNLAQLEPYTLNHRKLSIAARNKRIEFEKREKKRRRRRRYFGGGV